MLGPDDPKTAMALNDLAVLLQDLGRLEEREPHLERALRIYEAKLGVDDAITASVLRTSRFLGEPGGARRRASAHGASARHPREAASPDHPQVASALHVLGMLLGSLGEYAAGQAHVERALKIREKKLGASVRRRRRA